MRMFAGPNGSGKSTLKHVLPRELLGIYLNADDLESSLRRVGKLSTTEFGVQVEGDELLDFLKSAPILVRAGVNPDVSSLRFRNGHLELGDVLPDSYLAAAILDFLRTKLLQQRSTFTFETVMSHRSKVELLRKAQQVGYRTYLYYIATDDPAINISRVRSRVERGGHPVPDHKIIARYGSSLDLLLEAIHYTNRAYIFDNSTDNRAHSLVAEITDGKTLKMKSDEVPIWFKHSVLDKVKSWTES